MLLDSNIVMYAFQPKYQDTDFERFLEQGEFSASNLTRLEVKGYRRNSDIEFKKFAEFFDALRIFKVSDDIIEQAIHFRRQRSMGLADAIIPATALSHQLSLVTHNTRDFKWINELQLIDPLED